MRRGPIRTVVEHRPDGSLLLECGHSVYRRTTHDEKRRCAQCPSRVNFTPVQIHLAGSVDKLTRCGAVGTVHIVGPATRGNNEPHR